MASRLEKLILGVLCGAAIGLGATGCYDSDDQDMYGPPPDVSSDSDDEGDIATDILTDAPADLDPENVAMYGPAPMYGPEP